MYHCTYVFLIACLTSPTSSFTRDNNSPVFCLSKYASSCCKIESRRRCFNRAAILSAPTDNSVENANDKNPCLRLDLLVDNGKKIDVYYCTYNNTSPKYCMTGRINCDFSATPTMSIKILTYLGITRPNQLNLDRES